MNDLKLLHFGAWVGENEKESSSQEILFCFFDQQNEGIIEVNEYGRLIFFSSDFIFVKIVGEIVKIETNHCLDLSIIISLFIDLVISIRDEQSLSRTTLFTTSLALFRIIEIK